MWCFAKDRKSFGSRDREFRKIEGWKSRDFSVYMKIKHARFRYLEILYLMLMSL